MKYNYGGGICLYYGFMEWYVVYGIYCGMIKVFMFNNLSY